MWKGLKKEPGSSGKAFPCCNLPYHCAQNTATQVHAHTYRCICTYTIHNKSTHKERKYCKYAQIYAFLGDYIARRGKHWIGLLDCATLTVFSPFHATIDQSFWAENVSCPLFPSPHHESSDMSSHLSKSKRKQSHRLSPKPEHAPLPTHGFCCQIHNFPVSPLVFTCTSANICFP